MQTILELDIQNVTGSVLDDNGYVSYLVDGYGEEGSDQYDAVMPYGLISRPLDPDVDPGSKEPVPSRACSILTIHAGSETYGIPLVDPRAIALLPNLDKGETIVHNGFGVFSRYDKKGRVSHSTTTTGGTPAGQSVAEIVAPDSFQRFAPWVKERLDASALYWEHIGGAIFELGYVDGILPGMKSMASLEAHMIQLTAGAIGIGPKGQPKMPVAKVIPLVSVLQSIAAALEALTAGVATITATTPGAGAAAAAASAISEMQTAIAGAIQTLSTTTALG